MLDEYKSLITECKGCGRRDFCRQPVPFAGNPDASIFILGESPGLTEDETGVPFVGPSGMYLDGLLSVAGVCRDDVFITNVLKCYRNKKSVARGGLLAEDTLYEDAAACREHTLGLLGEVAPRLVVLLGALACNEVLGQNIRDCHAKVFDGVGQYSGLKCVATYHPAYILRNPAHRHLIEAGFSSVRQQVKEISGVHDSDVMNAVRRVVRFAESQESLSGFFDVIRGRPGYFCIFQPNIVPVIDWCLATYVDASRSMGTKCRSALDLFLSEYTRESPTCPVLYVLRVRAEQLFEFSTSKNKTAKKMLASAGCSSRTSYLKLSERLGLTPNV